MAESTGDRVIDLPEITSLGDFSVGDLVTNIRSGLDGEITKIIPTRLAADGNVPNPWPYLVSDTHLYAAHELVLIRPTGVAEIEEFLSRG